MNQVQLWVPARSTQQVGYTAADTFSSASRVFFRLMSSCGLLFLALRLKNRVIQRVTRLVAVPSPSLETSIRNFLPALLVRDLSTASSLAYRGFGLYL
jgi:hypothetical protein